MGENLSTEIGYDEFQALMDDYITRSAGRDDAVPASDFLELLSAWEWTATEDGSDRVVCGGSFVNDRFHARCAFRDWDLANSGVRLYGFRVCVSP